MAYQSTDSNGVAGSYKSTIRTFTVPSLSTTTTLEQTWELDVDFIK